jgi:hypothetical protein
VDPLAYCSSYADARRIGRMLADATDIGGHRAEVTGRLRERSWETPEGKAPAFCKSVWFVV